MEPLTQFRFERAIEWKREVEKYGITPKIEGLQQICLYLIEKYTASGETGKVQDMQEEYLRCQNVMKNDVEVQI